ncbi:putative transcription factor GRF family [Medicago truncatula]|uniref:Putative transcription factor GRF family n=1 Tax=Medicago truncatula TaxID=3880 RepID=A0A396IW14_MEDTR|nr:putative transcription factor GRF family [Medicago truncatula]
MFNGDVRVFECWCPIICVLRKVNTVKNSGRPFYACPKPKDDVENCEFFVWINEVEELGYFKNNGIDAGHGRKARLMEKF